MTVNMTCPPDGVVLTAEDEESLVAVVQDHARRFHDTELSREHILAEFHGEAPESAHSRGI